MDDQNKFQQQIKLIQNLMIMLFILMCITAAGVIVLVNNPDILSSKPVITEIEQPENTVEDEYDKIENGIHMRTGLVDAEGLMEVVNNCTNCHSALLITQNRMNEERWIATIRWMQETQNLWDLGTNEEIIVSYLTTNYPVIKKGRRSNLNDIQWYELQD